MAKYYPPKYQQEAFNCPNCGAFAKHSWNGLRLTVGQVPVEAWMFAYCDHCKNISLWYDSKLAYPDCTFSEPAHDDMPDDVKADYREAQTIASRSSRGAVALLRLALQKLMVDLGESGNNINADIGSLVKKGLPAQIQQALDAVRVIGNEAVHPGTMDIKDSPEIAVSLFGLINFIVDQQIAQPKRIKALYESLPPDKLDGIEKRDK